MKQLELFIQQAEVERDNPPGRQPIVRVPPQFPARCIKDGGGQIEEFVELMFDIAEDGSVSNIRVVDVSDECFVRSAKASVSNWQFEPQIEAGESVAIADQKTRITLYYDGE